jgi:hypothetical protein
VPLMSVLLTPVCASSPAMASPDEWTTVAWETPG